MHSAWQCTPKTRLIRQSGVRVHHAILQTQGGLRYLQAMSLRAVSALRIHHCMLDQACVSWFHRSWRHAQHDQAAVCLQGILHEPQQMQASSARQRRTFGRRYRRGGGPRSPESHPCPPSHARGATSAQPDSHISTWQRSSPGRAVTFSVLRIGVP